MSDQPQMPQIAGNQILITVKEDGSTEVLGPIGNKFFCYAALECAKDAVRNHVDRANKGPQIVKAPGNLRFPPLNGSKN